MLRIIEKERGGGWKGGEEGEEVRLKKRKDIKGKREDDRDGFGR